jgi:hypothetical protein
LLNGRVRPDGRGEDAMNETSLAEVVRQLDRTTVSAAPDAAPPAPAGASRETAILDGLRSTDRLLAELRARYRDLRLYRSRLMERLHELEREADGRDGVGAPGALAV